MVKRLVNRMKFGVWLALGTFLLVGLGVDMGVKWDCQDSGHFAAGGEFSVKVVLADKTSTGRKSLIKYFQPVLWQ
jgi:hypothetical protein